MKTHNVYCPNCDCKLQIEEYLKVSFIINLDEEPYYHPMTEPQAYPKVSFIIDLDGNPIDNCPECLIPLIVVDGELKHDKLQNS